ncbi:MAG: ribosome silencing factor [Candidatus Omnitrophica bacterium]|nr:ribosome silencing factor [Candidatus Omnitrophota bacterium]
MKKSRSLNSRDKAKRLLEAASRKHPLKPVVLDLRKLNFIWDYFVIVSSTSLPHSSAILEELVKLSKEEGFSIHHMEKDEEGGWSLIDYVDVCFHIFSEERRDFYKLERLFKDAKKVAFRFRR